MVEIEEYAIAVVAVILVTVGISIVWANYAPADGRRPGRRDSGDGPRWRRLRLALPTLPIRRERTDRVERVDPGDDTLVAPSVVRAGGRRVPAPSGSSVTSTTVLEPVLVAESSLPREQQLPARVVASCGWNDAFFHGWCANGDAGEPSVRLVVRGAALRGVTHGSLNIEGQDTIGAAWDSRRQTLYVAVADGLGSLPQSGPVSVETVNAALHLCVSRPDGMPFAEAGERMFKTIAAGLHRKFTSEEGAATLVVAEIIPRFDGATVNVHGVGDSEAWALFNMAWTPLHHERGRGDNATRELPSCTSPLTISYDLPPGSVLLLGSDGMTGALDTDMSPLARILATAWRQPPRPLAFVGQVGFVDDYWSDDRGAVAVWIGQGPDDE